MIQDILNANFIVIKVSENFLPSASALYTYALTQHKKVSIVCEENFDGKIQFIPWLDKVKTIVPSSSDLVLDLKMTVVELYNIFIENSIKINSKMATALYAGLLQETRGFLHSNVDGTYFALANVLIERGAEYKTCNKFIMKTKSLSFLRLKAILLKEMQLIDNASIIIMHISDDILKSTGSKLNDCEEIMIESSYLPHAKEVRLIKTDESNIIIKKINKEVS